MPAAETELSEEEVRIAKAREALPPASAVLNLREIEVRVSLIIENAIY